MIYFTDQARIGEKSVKENQNKDKKIKEKLVKEKENIETVQRVADYL